MSSTRACRPTQERSCSRVARQTLLQCLRGLDIQLQQNRSRVRVRTKAQSPHRPKKVSTIPKGRVHEDAPSRGASRPKRQARFYWNRTAIARQGEL